MVDQKTSQTLGDSGDGCTHCRTGVVPDLKGVKRCLMNKPKLDHLDKGFCVPADMSGAERFARRFP